MFLPYKQSMTVATFLDIIIEKKEYEDALMPKGLSTIFLLPADFAQIMITDGEETPSHSFKI